MLLISDFNCVTQIDHERHGAPPQPELDVGATLVSYVEANRGPNSNGVGRPSLEFLGVSYVIHRSRNISEVLLYVFGPDIARLPTVINEDSQGHISRKSQPARALAYAQKGADRTQHSILLALSEENALSIITILLHLPAHIDGTYLRHQQPYGA